ncbi:spore germination protein [Paenibacillus piri]|uniref:spore germination protein n=1 Tax=Paenibacillus piri TaxID=2547395 RepID=UPI00319E43A0
MPNVKKWPLFGNASQNIKTRQLIETNRSDTPLTIEVLKQRFQYCDDIVFQPLNRGYGKGTLVFLKEIASNEALSEVQGVLFELLSESAAKPDPTHLLNVLSTRFLLGKVADVKDARTVISGILSGCAILLLEECHSVFMFPTANSNGRSIAEPNTDQVVRGPREGFVERIDTNILLLRRRIQSSSLKVQYLTVGKQSHTRLAIVYVEDIAEESIVEEVRRRLTDINIDAILESNYIEELIADGPYSPFPTIYNSERPDRVCGDLLEGKVAIVTDGTPFVLTVPALFVEFFQSNEDYYDSFYTASIIRLIRVFGAIIAMLLPAFYVAVTTIHQDVMQTPLLIRVAGSREDLPFPVMIEALFMQLTFEVVREAGLRMPKAVGNAVTIVGTLVIGQAAVQAGLVGALMVIVVALTALTTFILPNYSFMQVFRYGNFPMLILAGLFGLMGILVGLMLLLAHLCSLRSFGVPYLSPVTPSAKEGWKDVLIRAPWWSMKKRNPVLADNNLQRSNNEPPLPPEP